MKYVAIFLLATVACLANADYTTVPTKSGPVVGETFSDRRQFLGIPFAAPPVGNLRFAAPQAPAPWTSPRNATSFAPGCPQVCQLPPHTCPEVQSEDCLYLDVYTPSTDAPRPWPVLVFFHGGNYRQGSISTVLYDGGYMAQRGNAIIVTAAYRLGPFGWLAIGDLKGNYGLYDQRAALQWVRDNIAAFGGDANSITLFGQSAGATSIAVHLTTAQSKTLFDKAIVQSDPLQLPLRTLKDANDLGAVFTKTLKCNNNDAACMRSASVDAVVAAGNAAAKFFNYHKPLQVFYPWTPVIDNVDVVGQPIDLFRAGQFNQVPMIFGSTTEEALLFIYMASEGNRVSDAIYSGVLLEIFGFNQAVKVIAKYPPPIFGDKRPLLSDLGTDMIFTCAIRNTTDNAVLHMGPSVPVYNYIFNHTMTFDAWGPHYNYCIGHSCHGAELPYLFHVQLEGVFQMTPSELVMATQMVDYWTNFAHTGNPNKGPNPANTVWPQYSPTSRGSIMLATPVQPVYGFSKKICDWWDTQGYAWGY